MDQVWHAAYSSYRSNVVPFINLYHGPQQQFRGGVLKTLSEYFSESEEIIDGNPLIVTMEGLESVRTDAIFRLYMHWDQSLIKPRKNQSSFHVSR